MNYEFCPGCGSECYDSGFYCTVCGMDLDKHSNMIDPERKEEYEQKCIDEELGDREGATDGGEGPSQTEKRKSENRGLDDFSGGA